MVVGSARAIGDAIKYLQQLEEFGLLELNFLVIWVPQSKSWQEMEWELAGKHFHWCRNTMLESVQYERSEIQLAKAVVQAQQQPDDSLTAAIASLYQALLDESTGEASRQRRKEALANYRKAHWTHVLQPLFEQISALIDPLERTLQSQLAILYDVLHDKALALRKRQFVDVYQPPDHRDKTITELLAISGQIVQIWKELSRCKSRFQKSAAAKRLPITNIPRFNNSVWTATN